MRNVFRVLLPFLFAGATGLAFPAFAQTAVNNPGAAPAVDDPYLWLEEVEGKRALEFAAQQNARTVKMLEARPEYAPIRDEVRQVLDSRDRIPYVSFADGYLYNFWRDSTNPRGLWRRTTWDEYRKPQPAWEVVLDLDALATAEKENWVWAGASCLRADRNLCLLRLSRGGGDAVVVREFNMKARAFVKDGFNLPEAKSRVIWRDRDTVYVGTNFGEGSLTDSGYPRLVKRWKRGTPLASAATVFEGEKTDVSVEAWVDDDPAFFREGFERGIAFYNSKTFLQPPGDGAKLVHIDVPDDAQPQFLREWLIVRLRSDWTIGGRTYAGGSLIAERYDAFAKGERKFDVLFAPTSDVSLSGWTATLNAVLLNVLDKVRGRVVELRYSDAGKWILREVPLPGVGTASASPVDAVQLDEYWINYQDFLTPATLSLARVGSEGLIQLKSLPKFFDAAGLTVKQLDAVSKDGTRIPYFIVSRADRKAAGPTLLYGYGGFEITMAPFYSGGIGNAWLKRGGTFVLANIRGGGEFGPKWHQAALKANRQKAYDDFIAVAEDLIQRGIATRQQLGIMGGSNGGLLVGAVMVERPDLFGAVVCQVPLLDMKRYNHLLAGASWMAEYGDPDKPEEWAYISKYSPYQNVRKDVKYPPVLFTTSTRDDRVHPGHARKMVARMIEQGHPDVFYYENIEGGHAGSANNEQRAKMTALEYAFLWQQLSRTK